MQYHLYILPSKMEYCFYPHSVTTKILDKMYETLFDISQQRTVIPKRQGKKWSDPSDALVSCL